MGANGVRGDPGPAGLAAHETKLPSVKPEPSDRRIEITTIVGGRSGKVIFQTVDVPYVEVRDELFVPCEGCGKYVQGPPRLTPARLEQGGFSWQAALHDCREDCRS